MKTVLLLVPIALASIAPVMAAPAQPTKQGATQQTRANGYWLSRDLQRLVFWQPHEHGAQAAETPASPGL